MTRKQERHAARRAGIMEGFHRLLSMTLDTRDNNWLFRIMIEGPFEVSSWKEFEGDVEVQELRARAREHYAALTADWPVVTC